MKAYVYDSQGYLVGTMPMQRDPLESEIKGEDVFLMPASATAEEPPKATKGKVPRWTGATWALETAPQEVVVKPIESVKEIPPERKAEADAITNKVQTAKASLKTAKANGLKTAADVRAAVLDILTILGD